MKKILLVLIATIFVGVGTVNASVKDDLLARLDKSYTLGGETVEVKEDYKVQFKQFLTNTEATDEEMQAIIDGIDSVVDYFKKYPEEFENFSVETEDFLLDVLHNMESIANIDITIDDDLNIVIESTRVEGAEMRLPVEGDATFIQPTGSNYVLVTIASLISVGGLAVLTKKFVGTNA